MPRRSLAGVLRVCSLTRPLATILLATILAGCAAQTREAAVEGTSDSESSHRPYGPLGVGHPLIGSLWNIEERRDISIGEFTRLASHSVFILLGEQHDNPEHHLLQAQIIEAMAHQDRHPVVALEMIDVDAQGGIDACFADGVCSADEFRASVAWDDSGWPAWEIYEPVISSALQNGVSVVAANLPREKAKTLARDSGSSQARVIAEEFGIQDAPSPGLRAAMAEEIRNTHCGHAPESMIDGMILAQRARDAQMAERLYLIQKVHRGDQIVLIAGFGHTRKDRGVPSYLKRLVPFSPVIAVAFIEVDDGWTDLADVAEAFGGTIPYDFVGFTERASDVDPCEAFREQLERMTE